MITGLYFVYEFDQFLQLTIFIYFSFFKNIFSSLNEGLSVDLDDLIETTSSVLDELWRLDSFSYPQSRMEKLMDAIGNSIGLYLQKTLEKLDIWHGDFNTVKDVLNLVNIIEKQKKNIIYYILGSLYYQNINNFAGYFSL